MTIKTDISEVEKYAALPHLSNDEIADCLGMCRATFYNRKRDDPDFAEALKTGPSKGRARRLLALDKAADGGDWHAAHTLLKMDCPDRYVERKQVDLNATVEEMTTAITMTFVNPDGTIIDPDDPFPEDEPQDDAGA